MNNFKPLIISFLLLTIATSNSFAKVLHWADYCESGNLKVTNETNEEQSVWLQKFNPQLANETEFTIDAKSSRLIKIEKTEINDRFSLLTFSNENEIKALYQCGGQEIEATEHEGGQVIYQKNQISPNKLWLQNIYYTQNEISLEYLDEKYNLIRNSKISLKSGESLTLATPTDLNWKKIRISSTYKYLSYFISNNNIEKPTLVKPVESVLDPTASYFLVGSRHNTGDSFVVKITNPEMIAKARHLIKNPHLEKMLFATVQKDHHGFNRNLNTVTKTHWSWSTIEVTNFDDFGSIVCNGQPQALEDRVESWTQDPGKICFWDYRVKKELSITEIKN